MARAFLRLLAGWVPVLVRDRWVEEWEGELEALDQRLSGRSGVRRALERGAFIVGAAPHALTLRRMEPGRTGRTMMGQDLRFAMRSFRRAPGFAVLALVTLALGIGATTTMFSVLDGVLLRSLPYHEAGRLVMVGTTSPRIPGLAPTSPADFRDWRERNTVFTHLVATEGFTLDLTDGDRPARVQGAGVTGGFFELLGAAPFMGRTIDVSDDRPGAAPVVVISHGLWERRYGADPGIVGKSVSTADQVYTVVGVMPETFVHPEALWSDEVEMWLPQALTGSDMETRNGRFLQVMARLAEGTTLEQARDQMGAIGRALAEEHPQNEGRDVVMEPLRSQTTGDVRQGLLLLMGAVGMLLLIACVNVANLFMVRATERDREIAVRSAMGAGVGRIRRQVLTEGVALSLLGGGLGVGLAHLGVVAFRTFNPGDIPRAGAVGVDFRVLAFAFVVSVLTGVGFALAPTLRLGHSGRMGVLRDGARGASDGTATGRFRQSLVALELGLAVVLLVGAGLFVNSFLRLRSVDPGFDSAGAVTMVVNLPTRYGSQEQQSAFFLQLSDRLATIPGAEAVAYTSTLPLDGNRWLTGVRVEGRERDPLDPDVADYTVVSPGFFATMGIEVVEGREFSRADDLSSEPVALVNEAFGRRYFSGGPVVGQRIGLGGREVTWHTVVGSVGDVSRSGLDQPAEPELFVPSLQAGLQAGQVVVRSRGDLDGTVALMRERTWELDATLPLEFASMEEYVVRSTNQPRFYTQLFAAFAFTALLLAGVGVYGTMSYTVRQRGRELGIRVALGAGSGQVLRLVARQGLGVTAVGLVLGLAVAAAGSRVLDSFLYGVGSRDALTYAVGASFLAVVALVACYIPARRAGRIDPMTALRAE